MNTPTATPLRARPEPAARRSLRARLAAGPAGVAIAGADVVLFRAMLGAAVSPAAAAMAARRVDLGVHHPSDIFAGALLGTLVGELSR